MSLYRRTDSPYWWVDFTINGQRVQRSTETTDRRNAKQLLATWQAEAWRREYLGVRPDHKWEDAVLRWLQETDYRTSRATDLSHLRWFDPHLSGRDLRSIDLQRIEHLKQIAKRSGVTNSTINRRMSIVRAILRKAVNEWEWLERMPAIRMLREPLGRDRVLTDSELAHLCNELPDHLRAMLLFSLATGARQSNVKLARWSHIDLERRTWVIPAAEAKARKPIGIPLNSVAMDVLGRQQGQHSEFVFTYRGQPIRQVNTKAWRAAVKRAGIENLRWHDLRHTFASWHARNGTPMHVLQQLGGWNSVEMVKRYTHLSVEHLREHADRLPDRVVALTRAAGYESVTPKQIHGG